MNQHHNRMRALTSFALCLCMIATLFSGLASAIAAEAELLDGSYEGTGQGRNGNIVLRVTLADQTITAIDVVSQNETPRIWEKALALLPHIIEANSPEVDAITGATKSSEGIKAAVRDALAKADGSIPGSGTAEDPFVISTPAQLQSFAAHVDAGETAYTAASVLLGEDLDLSGINFNPIGAEGKTTAAAQAGKFFGGSFDGQGHTISGLTIAGEYETEANLGLFSALAPSARIKNLRLSGVSIQATQSGGFQNIRAGGIAGDTCKVASASDPRAAIVDGCTVSGQIQVTAADGQAFAGGILGRAFTKSAVINCVSDVNVLASASGSWNTAYAGGIAGMTGMDTVLANDASFGSQRAENCSGSSDAYAGGLSGVLSGKVYVCYATGDTAIAQMGGVEPQAVGALTGQATGSGEKNYYTGEAAVFVLDENGAETRLPSRPWPEDASGSLHAEAPMTRAEMAVESFAEILNGAVPAAEAALGEAELVLQQWGLENGRVLPGKQGGSEEPSIFASGDGSAADPWVILTLEQLQAFAASLTDTQDYTGKFVRLGADLDLSGADWSPVGGSSVAFNGDFNGAGHVLSGLTEGSETQPRELDGTSAHVGLFGQLSASARVHDLQLENVAIYTHAQGSAYVGGLAGRIIGCETEGDNHGAVIDHVFISGNITETERI